MFNYYAYKKKIQDDREESQRRNKQEYLEYRRKSK